MRGRSAARGVTLNLTLFCAIAFASCADAQACPDLSSSSPKELITFLEQSGRTAEPTCVKAAIVRLGDAKDASAVDVLIGLLEFRRPDTELEKQHLLSMEDRFPAVEALFQIGTPAIPALISTIANYKTTELSRQNALRALEEMHSEDPAATVVILLKASRGAKSGTEAVRLESAAKDVLKYCGDRWRDRCEAALKGNK